MRIVARLGVTGFRSIGSIGFGSIGLGLMVGLGLGGGLAMLDRGMAIAANPYTVSGPPVIRANPNAVQNPVCYAEMTSQGRLDLNSLCEMSKPKGPAMLDIITDRDKDGIPDDLMVPFQQFRDLERSAMNATDDPSRGFAKFAQGFEDLNARIPYVPATATAIRELTQLMRQYKPDGNNAAQLDTRARALSEQLDKDPTYVRMRNLYQEFQSRSYQNESAPTKPARP
jgi:hypothetical protein